jgi:arylesterase/paraoxonase
MKRHDRFTRVVILVWVVAGVILLTGGFRAVMAMGLLSFGGGDTAPGICRPIGLPAPGDLVYEHKNRMMFIASNPVNGQGAIYVLPDGQSKPVKLAGTPADFHPVSISIGYELGGEPSLAVVDRKASGTMAVELYAINYDAKGASLSYQATTQGGLARRADGVVAMGSARFYLTANPTSSDLMAWADRWLLLGRANLLFFNGTLFMDAVAGLSDPSGVAASADGRFLYVLSRNERRLIAFSRDAFTGTLTELDSISLPMRPERVAMDTSNVLWVAGSTRIAALGGSSRVVRVFLNENGTPQSQETVYGGDGIARASAAARSEKQLFIGSTSDEKLLACEIK